jgi:hypothetical protein
MRHLEHEGLAERSRLVGDVMTDVLFGVRDRVLAGDVPAGHDLPHGDYRVATIHRPDNTDDPTSSRGSTPRCCCWSTPACGRSPNPPGSTSTGAPCGRSIRSPTRSSSRR